MDNNTFPDLQFLETENKRRDFFITPRTDKKN